MTRARSRQRASGFTLVELLVVMALIALMSAMLFGGLRYTERTAARGTATLDRAADIGLAAGFLEAALGDAQPFPDATDGTIEFAGGSDRLVLIGAAPPHVAAGGLYRIAIGLERDRSALATRWAPFPLGDDLPEAAAALPPSSLLDQVSRAEFGYFGTRSGEAAPAWHDAWEGQPALPALVRLRIGFTDGTSAPDLIIAVRTAGSAP